MKNLKIASAAVLLCISATTLAAKPTSIVFNENAEGEDGRAYSSFTVKCSNGRTAQLTAWDSRRKWCVGDAASETCEKRQIKAAKTACKAA
ncbi:MAG: hypothetical protein ACI9NT_002537 [Bacteroidia bacterium]|jgi:hypothetical protein